MYMLYILVNICDVHVYYQGTYPLPNIPSLLSECKHILSTFSYFCKSCLSLGRYFDIISNGVNCVDMNIFWEEQIFVHRKISTAYIVFMEILNIKEIGLNLDVNEHERLTNITLRPSCM